MSMRPHPYEPTIRSTSPIRVERGSRRPSRATGSPCSKRDDQLGRLGGGRGGQLVDLLRRLLPGVLQDSALDRAPPEVLVDAVRAGLGDGDRDAPLLRRTRSTARGSGPSPGPAPAPRGRAPGPRWKPRSGPGRCPSRCSRGRWRRRRRRRAVATRCLTITGRDSDEISGYLPSYLALALQGGGHEVVGVLLPHVDHDGLDRPRGQGPVLDGVPVAALADVGGQRDDLDARAPRSSSAPPPTCPVRRCRPAPLASPRSELRSLRLSVATQSRPGAARRRASPAPPTRSVGHHHDGVVPGDGTDDVGQGRPGRGPRRPRGPNPAGCGPRPRWRTAPRPPPTPRAPAAGGPRGPPGPWAARARRRPTRRRRRGP